MHSSSSESIIRVLIVEDHKLTRIGLKLVLKRIAGVEVVAEADNGEAAFSLARELSPNLIFMDVGLPVLNGIAALAKIKAEAPSCLVIMLTSRGQTPEISAALASGADGYCLKDGSAEKLGQALERVVAGQLWLDPELAASILELAKEYSPADDKRALRALQLSVNGLTRKAVADELGVSLTDVNELIKELMDRAVNKAPK